MSHSLISRSPDLKRLRDEGYEVEVRAGYLFVHSVPYVNALGETAFGTLASDLVLAGDVTSAGGTTPATRQARRLSRSSTRPRARRWPETSSRSIRSRTSLPEGIATTTTR